MSDDLFTAPWLRWLVTVVMLAGLCLLAIFLPGLLILVGTLPFWDALRHRPGAQAARGRRGRW